MRLIDADALVSVLRDKVPKEPTHDNFTVALAVGACIHEIDNANTIIDAVPMVHGKWELVAIEHNAYRWQVDAVCSCCGFVKQGVWGGFFPDAPSEIAESVVLRYAGKVKLPRYCETCGAKMDGERRGGNEAD